MRRRRVGKSLAPLGQRIGGESDDEEPDARRRLRAVAERDRDGMEHRKDREQRRQCQNGVDEHCAVVAVDSLRRNGRTRCCTGGRVHRQIRYFQDVPLVAVAFHDGFRGKLAREVYGHPTVEGELTRNVVQILEMTLNGVSNLSHVVPYPRFDGPASPSIIPQTVSPCRYDLYCNIFHPRRRNRNAAPGGTAFVSLVYYSTSGPDGRRRLGLLEAWTRLP